MSRPEELKAQARQAIDLLGGPPQNWVPNSGTDNDVTIIGGGQSGIAIGFALRRAGISRFEIFDEAPAGSSNWNTVARMRTLRTPKTITGPELGMPQLSFRYWYEGLHGEGSFARIGKIATADWAAYFDWYKDVLDIPVANGHRLTDVQPDDGHLRLMIESAAGTRIVTTRKLVLATGMGGFGDTVLPAQVAALPQSARAHTHDRIDFAALRGKRIGVLGAASGAFDAAAVALEHGAAAVELFCRHDDLAVQKVDSRLPLITDLHITTHFIDLSDAQRWQAITRGRARGVVPEESVARAQAFGNFKLHLNARWDDITYANGNVTIASAAGPRSFDYLIAATGYSVDISARPELSAIAPVAALWRDRYAPPADQHDAARAIYPYVGRGLQLQERVPGTAPWLGDIHVFNFAAILNHGFHVGDISSASICVPRLVTALAHDLFHADASTHLAALAGPQIQARDHAA
jgi:cation diffusion facilitator CzcD-associated flavoprotein CzcO